MTAGGVYLAVPDTELARAMLGVAVPFVFLSVPRPLSPLGPAGSAAIAGLFSWVVVVGGRGRPGSVVGGLATIGILVAEPLGRRTIGAVNLMTIRTRLRYDHPRYDRNRDEWITRAALSAIVQFLGGGVREPGGRTRGRGDRGFRRVDPAARRCDGHRPDALLRRQVEP